MNHSFMFPRQLLLSLLFYTLYFISDVNAQQLAVPLKLNEGDAVKGSLLFKVKPGNEHAVQLAYWNEKLGASIGVEQVQFNFPAHVGRRKNISDSKVKDIDLGLIAEIKFNPNRDLYSTAQLMLKSGVIEWIQPRYIAKPMSIPNDPLVGTQYHHALIKTFEAWDIQPGDTSIVIAITDAGIQFDHEDLADNVYYNYSDPVNGLDDDGDGYIDNFSGWNASLNNNNPTATTSPHGMFTTGMLGAVSNNGLGIAGNVSNVRFMTIKIDSPGGFTHGYEGLVYAADLNVPIINASWGSTFVSPFGEEVTRYVTEEKGLLLIAAAGNTGTDICYYPACYPNVVSVGSTGATDAIWSGSTFHDKVSIMAPGELVQSTWAFNGYNTSSGTSFSAPLVAGAAALVKAQFPDYTSEQIAARLRAYADTSLFALPANEGKRFKMGGGRLDMLQALTGIGKPAIRFVNTSLEDGNDNILLAGDEVLIQGSFKNILDPSLILEARISCESPFIEILDDLAELGSIATLEEIPNSNQPFRFRILPGVPVNHEISFRIDYSDFEYVDFEILNFKVNLDYMDLTVNELHTTVSSRGNIGYNADFAGEGLGITFQGSESLIYSSTFMLGTAPERVADNGYAAVLPGFDADFERVQQVELVDGTFEDETRIRSIFETEQAALSPIRIIQEFSARTVDPFHQYIEASYEIQNTGEENVSNLFAGWFTDWDINGGAANQAAFNANNRISYAWDAGAGIYAGIVLLDSLDVHGYCFTNNGTSGSMNLYDGFSNQEKYDALSGALTRTSATGEISNLLGTGPFELEAQSSIRLSVAIVAGNSLNELFDNAYHALRVHTFKERVVSIDISDAGCDGNSGTIDLVLNTGVGTVSLVDEELEKFGFIVANNTEESFEQISAGVYGMEFTFLNGTAYETGFFETLESEPVSALIITASDTITLPEESLVLFTAGGEGATSYSWDFGDGFTGEGESFSHTFSFAGEFTVTLVASNESCSDTATFVIHVGDIVTKTHLPSLYGNVYPNPARDVIRIQSYENRPVLYHCYDVCGRIVASWTVQGPDEGFSVSHLSDGLYYLRATGETNMTAIPFVVQR